MKMDCHQTMNRISQQLFCSDRHLIVFVFVTISIMYFAYLIVLKRITGKNGALQEYSSYYPPPQTLAESVVILMYLQNKQWCMHHQQHFLCVNSLGINL